MGDKPTAAFVLSLIGSVIYLLVGLLVAVAAAFVGSFADMAGIPGLGVGVAVIGGIGLVCGIIMLIASVMMNSSQKSRVTTGAILVLVFALVGALFTVGGFVIGFILALIGAILGLTWKPSQPPTPQPASPMQ